MNEDVKKSIEMYLGEDILQGERVPFYLLWKNDSIEKITITYQGFKSLVRLYNARECKKTINGAIVEKDAIKTKGYLGGVLSTTLYESPAHPAELEVVVQQTNGDIITFKEQRILHSARVTIDQPAILDLSNKSQHNIIVNIQGAATVLVNIFEIKGGLELTFPPEVLTSLQKFTEAIGVGTEKLKKEFPQHSELLSLFSGFEEKSITQMQQVLQKNLQKVRDDKEFTEALALVFVTGILQQTNDKDSFMLSMLEYFEAGTSAKAVLSSPFLCVKVPRGGGFLRCKLEFFDILQHRCAKPINVKTRLISPEEKLVQLKELIKFTRSE